MSKMHCFSNKFSKIAKLWGLSGIRHQRSLKVGCIAFQCRLWEQVFSPKAWKKFGANPSFRFREKRKNCTNNSEKWRHRAEG